MKSMAGFLLVSSIFFAAGPFSILAAEPFRYRLEEGSTNVYRVTLESPSEVAPRKFEGLILVSVTAADENGANLVIRGNLAPVQNMRQGGAQPMMFPAGHPFDRWRMQPIPPFAEVRVDQLGRVVRTLALPNLPGIQQNYAELFFQAMPEKHAEEWATEAILEREEEAVQPGQPGFHPGMRMGGPFGQGSMLKGTLAESSKIIESTEAVLRVERESEFRSWMRNGDEPRLALKSKVQFELDRASGTLKGLKLEGRSISSTTDFQRRVPLVLTVERVEGEEFEEAIRGSGLVQGQEITDEGLARIVEELKSGDPEQVREAAQRLLAANWEDHAEKLLPVMIPLVDDPDGLLQNLAGNVLGAAATIEEVPLLLRMLERDNGQDIHAVMALGRLTDKRAIEPLADAIARGLNSAHMAAQALAKFGPVVEETALALLKEKHRETRRLACEILQQAGTSKSLEPLKAVAADDSLPGHAAKQAIQMIRERSEKMEKMIF